MGKWSIAPLFGVFLGAHAAKSLDGRVTHSDLMAVARGLCPGGRTPHQNRATNEDLPLSNLCLTMLHKLGVETDSFADSTGTIYDV